MGDHRYPELALASIRKMVELKGFLNPLDMAGQPPAATGVLARHLVLPGQMDNSLAVLRRLRQELGRWLPLSIMSQVRPIRRCMEKNLLTRPVTAEEYQQVCGEAEALGFENVFIQPVNRSDDFLPDFRRQNPFKGNAARGKPG